MASSHSRTPLLRHNRHVLDRLGPSRPAPAESAGAIEITRELSLGEREQRLLEMHSLLNVLNVAVLRLQSFGRVVGDAATAQRLTDLLVTWQDGLVDRERTLEKLRRVPEIRLRLLDWASAQAHRVPTAEKSRLDALLENLASIFSVLETRAAELLARRDDPLVWQRFTLDHLRENLLSALRAMEKNSLGHWRLALAPAEGAADAYRVSLEVRSRDGATAFLPAVLEDVLRDLSANARKFTDPGGTIRVLLAEEESEILLEVEDTGRGILAEEIEKVVDFGKRGSIQRSNSHNGGGFGLTKAYQVTRALGGRMWIRSAVGRGTTITLRLPCRA